MSILDWKVTIADEVVAQVLSCQVGLERPRIVTTTLGGSVHIQSYGETMKHAEISFISTLDEKLRFEQLEILGHLISFVYRGKKYSGYFASPLSWNTVSPAEWFASSGTLLITEEVDVNDSIN